MFSDVPLPIIYPSTNVCLLLTYMDNVQLAFAFSGVFAKFVSETTSQLPDSALSLTLYSSWLCTLSDSALFLALYSSWLCTLPGSALFLTLHSSWLYTLPDSVLFLTLHCSWLYTLQGFVLHIPRFTATLYDKFDKKNFSTLFLKFNKRG